MESGMASEAAIAALKQEIDARSARRRRTGEGRAPARRLTISRRISMPSPRTATYRAAVLEALFGEMRRDGAVIMMGEDIGAAGGVFKQTEGLFAEFGAARVIDTPISEVRRLRHGGRRRHDRPAAGVRDDVRRFHHPDHGPAGQPGGQDQLHVGRPVPRAAGGAHRGRRRRQSRAAAFAEPARLAGAYSRAESGDARRRRPTPRA